MKNVWIGSMAALALACTVGIGAQTPASPATSTSQAAPDTITVTGCLKAADAMGGATGTSGSATPGSSSTASSSDRFMLANATMGAATATTASTGTAGTSTAGSTAAGASSPMKGAGSSYALNGDASELRRHLNHQVEIKGRLDSSASSTASRPGTATGTTATGTTATPSTSTGQDASAAKTLRVESVKMIAATCPAQ